MNRGGLTRSGLLFGKQRVMDSSGIARKLLGKECGNKMSKSPVNGGV